MNTADLIEHVAAEHGVAKEHAKKILDSALAAITAAASAGEEVTLAGFGRFKVTDRAERQGRNPATGETITIAASKKLAFTAAKSVRDTLNAGGRQPRQCRAIPAGRRARCLSTHSACSPNSKPICAVSAGWKGIMRPKRAASTRAESGRLTPARCSLWRGTARPDGDRPPTGDGRASVSCLLGRQAARISANGGGSNADQT